MIGNGTAAEMRDALERVGRGVLDYRDGDPGVQTMCPLCAHGIVLWTEQHRRWICDQPDCPGRDDSSRIAYALEDEGPGGFAEPESEPETDFANCQLPRDVANGKESAERFTTRRLDASEFRPVEFAWEHRLVTGVLNVLAGTEGIGKGTLLAWLIAQLTRGGLPGQLRGRPARVLWLGDEDSWTHVVGPRLHAAGADLALVEEMISSDGRLFNVHQDAAELERIIAAGPFDVVVFEALLDHMPAGRNGDPTQHVRLSLAPTRAVFRRRGTTALATMHTRKGAATSFRDLMAGSHQYNALSRSSLLLAVHPQDEDRRIIVAGKQNYSRASVTESFELVEHGFDLNEHGSACRSRGISAWSPRSRSTRCSFRRAATRATISPSNSAAC
jgi:AAA domain